MKQPAVLLRPAYIAAPKKLVVAIALAAPFSLLNQSALADEEPSNAAIKLAPVAVTANPLGVASDELVVPIISLSGRELSLRRESTLGDTLKFIPGVSATSYGPNSSRPVIRGLDAERVRILQNGIGILDASSLSFDHAVALDPLVIEQIDVVRGPATLLYGGGAVGGVVNAIDHRIPQEAIDGITGRGEIRLGGADDQRNGAFVVDAGNEVLTIHADAYARESNDLRIKGDQNSRRLQRQRIAAGETGENVTGSRGRLANSAARGNGGALGASINLQHGYAGASFSTFNNKYGVVADPDVLIDQKSDRWDLASELRELGPLINRLRVRLAHTDYMHEEIENGEVGTTFKNRGLEGSIEAGHTNVGNMSGVFGLQFQNTRFEAIGDEAFVPPNQTKTRALYIYEELPIDDLKLSFGGRIERARIESDGGERFGATQSKRYTPASFALGGIYTLDDNWSLASNLSHNERAPSYFELYANGPHLATGTFEIGDAGQRKERSNGIDAQLRWKAGNHSFSVGGYYTRFSNFTGLFSTGRLVDENGNTGNPDSDLIEAEFRQVKAVFKGLEAEGKFRLYEQVGELDLSLRGDYVRASSKDEGGSLPRISPVRLGFGLDYRLQRFGSRLDVLHAFNQSRTGENELATDGYTLVNATFSYQLPARFHLEAFAQAQNLLDEEVREHTSFIKDISLMGRRSIILGLRGEF